MVIQAYQWIKLNHVVQQVTLALCLVVMASSGNLLGSQKQESSGWLDAMKQKFNTTGLASIAYVRKQTLKKLNEVIPNFAQNLRTTKKTLEIALHYLTTIMKKLDIPENMSLDEVNAAIAHIEAAINKLEEQKRRQHSINPQDIDSMSAEQVKAAVRSGALRATDLTSAQIEKFYGPAEEVN